MPKNLNICLLLDYYGNMLTQKQYEVVDFYYNEDLSLAEISEHMGITRQGVRDSIKRGEAILLETEERLGFVRRLQKTQKFKQDIIQAIDDLDDLNQRRLFSSELGERIERLRGAVNEYAAGDMEEDA